MYDGVEIRINRYGLLLSLEEELSEFPGPSVSCWGDGCGGQWRTNLQLRHEAAAEFAVTGTQPLRCNDLLA